jgi:hypothetical protein
MWVSGVLTGLDTYLPLDSTPDATQMVRLMGSWRQELSALMTWLDWSVWVKCRPACGPEVNVLTLCAAYIHLTYMFLRKCVTFLPGP